MLPCSQGGRVGGACGVVTHKRELGEVATVYPWGDAAKCRCQCSMLWGSWGTVLLWGCVA